MKITPSTALIFGAESTFNGPAEIVESVDYIGLANAGDFSPFSNATGLPIVNKKSIVPPVSCLSNNGGPSTIFGTVAKRIVYSVNGVFWRWAKSHVGKEIWEGMPPAITDGYPAASVIAKFNSVWIGAPVDHLAPSFVFDGPFTMLAAPMLCGPLGNPFALKTAARRNGSASEVSGKDCLGVSAFTQAIPQGHFGGSENLAAGVTNHHKPSKFLAGQVLELLVSWKWMVNRFVSGVHNLSMDFVSAASGLQSHVARLFSHNLNRWSTEVLP